MKRPPADSPEALATGSRIRVCLDDSLMKMIGSDEKEAAELLAMALYKYKGIHGSLAGKLIGKTEFEFHALLSSRGVTVNYDVDDLVDDIKKNDL